MSRQGLKLGNTLLLLETFYSSQLGHREKHLSSRRQKAPVENEHRIGAFNERFHGVANASQRTTLY